MEKLRSPHINSRKFAFACRFDSISYQILQLSGILLEYWGPPTQLCHCVRRVRKRGFWSSLRRSPTHRISFISVHQSSILVVCYEYLGKKIINVLPKTRQKRNRAPDFLFRSMIFTTGEKQQTCSFLSRYCNFWLSTFLCARTCAQPEDNEKYHTQPGEYWAKC